MVLLAFLARELLKKKKLKRGYRIIWIPETIGAIAYCYFNEKIIRNIKNALVITTVGGPGDFSYKQSYNYENSINVIIEEVFKELNLKFVTYPFDIRGSDERQYSSLGFNINTASIHKDKYYEYDYYHTSLDDLSFVSAANIAKSLNIHLKVLEKLNLETVYINIKPNCEIMLSKHELYPKLGGGYSKNTKFNNTDIILWLCQLCDGNTGMYAISNKLDVNIKKLESIAEMLCTKGILKNII
jgi:aminopeptidase-like protein